MSPPDRFDGPVRDGGAIVEPPISPSIPLPHAQRNGARPAPQILGDSELRADPPVDLRLGGSPSGLEPGWTDRRIARWVRAFLALGIALRLLRIGLNFPFWHDEAYLALNVLERDYAGLTQPLGYAQVCPLLFLWAERAATQAFGFSEWSLRLLPTIASVAGLVLFRHVAGRLLRGVALPMAVAILAVGYTPIRHGGEVKPYATDFLVALALIALAVEWLRARERPRSLWALAALGPLAVGLSNPSIFVAAGVGLVLARPVLETRSIRSIAPLAAFGVLTSATFLALLRWINGPQGDHVMYWMQVYWAGAFPPRSPGALIAWLAKVHTSQAFAYPAGGDHGASTLTTALVAAAVAAYVRRGPRPILALLLAPFGLGLVAAALGRYPYGGSARTMQYVAPSIILLAGLGVAALLARLPRPAWRERSPRRALVGLLAIGLGMVAWDATHPYKHPFFQASRDLARRFWAEESPGAELLCARADLRLPLDPLRWQEGREVTYLCHQAIYSARHRSGALPRLDRVAPGHPLRVVSFNETPRDAAALARWAADQAGRYTLARRRERVLGTRFVRGPKSFGDRYVIYEFLPARRSQATRLAGDRPRSL